MELYSWVITDRTAVERFLYIFWEYEMAERNNPVTGVREATDPLFDTWETKRDANGDMTRINPVTKVHEKTRYGLEWDVATDSSGRMTRETPRGPEQSYVGIIWSGGERRELPTSTTRSAPKQTSVASPSAGSSGSTSRGSSGTSYSGSPSGRSSSSRALAATGTALAVRSAASPTAQIAKGVGAAVGRSGGGSFGKVVIGAVVVLGIAAIIGAAFASDKPQPPHCPKDRFGEQFTCGMIAVFGVFLLYHATLSLGKTDFEWWALGIGLVFFLYGVVTVVLSIKEGIYEQEQYQRRYKEWRREVVLWEIRKAREEEN